MKHIFFLSVYFIFSAVQVFSQGNYRNTLPTYANTLKVAATDIETLPNRILITGLRVPTTLNPSFNQRVFFTNYSFNGSFPFNITYLAAGQDIPTIDPTIKFDIKEVKSIATGYVLCGNIISTGPQNYNQGFIIRTGLAGNCIWAKRYSIPGSKSVFFNSLQPTSNANGASFIVCGYRGIGNGVKKALLTKIDSLGNVITGAIQLNEPLVGGMEQQSEFKKVIMYNAKFFALTGYCSQLKDSCNDIVQSGMLFSMYELNTHVLRSKVIQSNPFALLDKKLDEGVSLVKTDSGVIILSRYSERDTVPCGFSVDMQSKLTLVNPVVQNNSATWLLVKTLRYNTSPYTLSYEDPRDLLYKPNSANVLHVYGNYNQNNGYLLHLNFNAAQHVSSPLMLNNHTGLPSIDGKTIDFNTANHVVGITNLGTSKYSLFEVTASQSALCLADSIPVILYNDTMKWANLNHDSLVMLSNSVALISQNTIISNTVYCDTVWAKPAMISESPNSSISVYPNPASEILTVSLTVLSEEPMRYVLYDITGKVIFQKSWKPHSLIENLDVSRIPEGLYFISIYQQEQRLYSGKISIKR